MHMRGGEILTCKIDDPITDIVVTCHVEAALLAVKDVTNQEFCSTAVTMVRQVRGLDVIAQEEGNNLFLRP